MEDLRGFGATEVTVIMGSSMEDPLRLQTSWQIMQGLVALIESLLVDFIERCTVFGDSTDCGLIPRTLLAHGAMGPGGMNNPWVISLRLVLDVCFWSGFDTGALPEGAGPIQIFLEVATRW